MRNKNRNIGISTADRGVAGGAALSIVVGVVPTDDPTDLSLA